MTMRDRGPGDPGIESEAEEDELAPVVTAEPAELLLEEAEIAEIEEKEATPVRRGRGGPPGRSFDRDWTEGNILHNLWTLAWPTTVSSCITMLGPTIDMIWVGSLGRSALAGVGVSGIAVMMVNSARMGINTGTRALLARAVGANNLDEANHVLQQAAVVSVVFSLVLALIGIFFAEALLELMGLEPDVIRDGAAYMRIMFVGSIAMSLGMMSQGAMQASGDAITPMKITTGVRFFHIALCPFLIFGLGPFPRLGVEGAAATNVISQGTGAAIMLWILFTGRTRLRLDLSGFRFSGSLIWRLVKIGIPASVTGMQRSLANFIVMMFIVPFGTVAVAAHTVCQRLDMFAFMPGMGLGSAAGVLAAQNVGADKIERAEKTTWYAVAIFTGLMVVESIVIWFFADYAIMIFNREPPLVDIASNFLKINIVSYLMFGIVMVLVNCLNGIGDTVVTMVVTTATLFLVQIPLAWILPQVTGLGVYGVRWGIAAAVVLRGIIYAIYFIKGRWKRIAV